MYEETVKRLKQALHQRQLKTILWHQGESNCVGPDKLMPEAYKEKLLTLMENLRKEAEVGDVLVIIGQLGRWRWAICSDIRAFNRMFRAIPDVLSASACVSSKGLEAAFPGTNDPYFGTESQLEFGKYYVDELQRLNKRLLNDN